MNMIEKKERVTVLLHRYAPNPGRSSFYSNPGRNFFNPHPPAPPIRANPSVPGFTAKTGNWLQQAQQFMATAEQVRPLIDQYGPMVKNLPQMWKLYRAVNSMPDPDSPEEKKTEPLKVEAPKKELLKKEKVEKEQVKKEPIRPAESVPWFPGRYS